MGKIFRERNGEQSLIAPVISSEYDMSMNWTTMLDSVENTLNELDSWITNNGWAGYDPYDVRGQDWFISLFGKQTWFCRKLRGLLYILENNLPPVTLRKILKVEREINAKGMGLLATAYLRLSSIRGCRKCLAKAEKILIWLRNNHSLGYPGISWGYPFHWQSRIMIPRGTPSSVVTCIVGDAWLDHYHATASPDSLHVASLIGDFLVSGLNHYEKNKEQLCFSYTPLDQFKVHNANLFVAAFLTRFGSMINNNQYIDIALKAVRYTLSEQNADGSFNYWSCEPSSVIDHYHTGFILRHLHTIYKITKAAFILEPLKKGYRFYLEDLFTPEVIPKFTPSSLYPIDIHTCAEALIVLSQLGTDLGGIERLEPVIDFTLSNMRSNQGYFIAKIQQRYGRERKVIIPYMRWAQCWMFLALTRLYQALVSKCQEGK